MEWCVSEWVGVSDEVVKGCVCVCAYMCEWVCVCVGDRWVGVGWVGVSD